MAPFFLFTIPGQLVFLPALLLLVIAAAGGGGVDGKVMASVGLLYVLSVALSVLFWPFAATVTMSESLVSGSNAEGQLTMWGEAVVIPDVPVTWGGDWDFDR